VITRQPIDVGEHYRRLVTEDSGAVVIFVGTVRNENEGHSVSHLEYDGYEALAEKHLKGIEAEIRARWTVRNVVLVHRLGDLNLGEASVLVGVSAPHREEAFAAAKYGIDRIKEAVPIWKKEYFSEGGARWLEGQVMQKPGGNAG
jgi:molybdopterin synthase catalytic subunit